MVLQVFPRINSFESIREYININQNILKKIQTKSSSATCKIKKNHKSSLIFEVILKQRIRLLIFYILAQISTNSKNSLLNIILQRLITVNPK